MKHMNEGSTFKPGHGGHGHFKPTGAKHETKFHPGKGSDGHKPGKYGGHEGHGKMNDFGGMHEKHMGEHHSGHVGEMGQKTDAHMKKAHAHEHYHTVTHHDDMKTFPEPHPETVHHYGPKLDGYEAK